MRRVTAKAKDFSPRRLKKWSQLQEKKFAIIKGRVIHRLMNLNPPPDEKRFQYLLDLSRFDIAREYSERAHLPLSQI